MESKHPKTNTPELKQEKEKALKELSSHLADIALKIDHLIENIHDSLYRSKPKRPEDFP